MVYKHLLKLSCRLLGKRGSFFHIALCLFWARLGEKLQRCEGRLFWIVGYDGKKAGMEHSGLSEISSFLKVPMARSHALCLTHTNAFYVLESRTEGAPGQLRSLQCMNQVDWSIVFILYLLCAHLSLTHEPLLLVILRLTQHTICSVSPEACSKTDCNEMNAKKSFTCSLF